MAMLPRWRATLLLSALACAACAESPGHRPEVAPADAEISSPDLSTDTTPDPGPDLAVDLPEIPPPLPCGGAPSIEVERGRLVESEDLRPSSMSPCTTHRWSLVGALGAGFRVSVDPGDCPGLQAALWWPDQDPETPPVATFSEVEAGEIIFAPSRSGEMFLRLWHAEPARRCTYQLRLSCTGDCGLEATRYPIVLVHGWTGWESIGAYTYFYQVPETLRGAGFAVHVASLDPYNAIEVRAPQLAAQIDAILVQDRAHKVNIIAHSQGGLDARYVISRLGYGDRVATLTTISTPHRGTPLTDVALGLMAGPVDDAIAFLLEWLGARVAGSESDARASFATMTVDFVTQDFNPATPDDPRVRYVSYAGRTCLDEDLCGDVCDLPIRFSYHLLTAIAGDNDGVVPVESAIWGEYRGTIPADHFDQVGQLFGATSAFFDHKAFYLAIARELAERF